MPRRELARHVRQPWHRRPDESEPAWRAFTAYLDQETPRDLGRVAMPPEASDSPRTFLDHWHTVHEWDARAASYDALRRRAEHDAIAGAAGVSAMRNLSAVNAGFEFIFREIRKWNDISRNAESPVLQASQVVPFLKSMVELQRLATGQSTANIAVAVRGVPDIPEEIATLTIEECEFLDAIQRKKPLR